MVDKTPPTILSCPPDVVVCPEAPREPQDLGFPTVNDNCAAVEDLDLFYDDNIVGNEDSSLTITRTFSVTDLDENTVRTEWLCLFPISAVVLTFIHCIDYRLRTKNYGC